jgi:hypothetical protein
MKPNDFRSIILPKILNIYQGKCICANSGLRSLMSFSFIDYRIGPIALADSEILIQELIRSGNESYDKTLIKDRGWDFQCKTCGSVLHEHYDEYSINMYQSIIEYKAPIAGFVPYLIGFYGFKLDECDKIINFKLTTNINEFLSYVNAAQQGDAPEPASPAR